MLYFISAIAISYFSYNGTAIALWSLGMGIGIMIGAWAYIKRCIAEPNFY